MKILVTLFSFFFALNTFSAPHPMTGSSAVNQLQSGLVFSQLGFRVQNFPADWQLKKSTDQDSAVIEVGPENTQTKSVLSFRVEGVNPKADLERYVRQYLRDYNQYGFEVVGLQSLKQTSLNSVVVDLNQKNKKTRSRQVFFKKDSRVVMATCIDDFEQFNKTILTCNQILGSFQWR